ncbi:VOC family protein [Pseudonocardia sp. ICBG1293]|uniref:VOC family protein n=1 Tax=Pseudonocardia sp. ICBG1293 TaxID=2844382 RepID=UPI001CCD8E62|nr:VOC family protein [Pseudonocardia sp. ICBG1293]
MTVLRMDNVGVVVDDIEEAVAFFAALGLEVEGRATVSGPDVDRLVGLDGVHCDMAVVRTPDGHGRLELMRFASPPSPAGDPGAAVNAPGIRRIMFAVTDVAETLRRLHGHGAEPVGDVVPFGGEHVLAYVRGPGGILVALAEETG